MDLYEGWKEFSSEILNEVEKKEKFSDDVEKKVFLVRLSSNIMGEKDYLRWKVTTEGGKSTSTPKAKCSMSDFLRDFKKKIIKNIKD